jgi:hypothetical protein
MRRVVLLLVVLGAIGLAAPGGAAAAETKCPFTFRVEHNDRIGSLQLPAGNYNIFVLNQAKLSCSQATDLFRQFLEDWDGRLPRPWINVKGTATFTRGSGSDIGFRVAKATGGGGGGGGGGHGANTCPSFFTVLHNDHIGRFRIAAGPYRITLLAVGRLSCARAARLLASFLQDYNGRLSGGWILDRETGTFSLRGSRTVGFRIKAAVGPPVNPNGPVYPSNGSVCPSFRVLHNDRIGRLRLRRGPYILTRLRGSGLTCSRAARLFRTFLNDPDGDLPRPWIVQTQNGTFRRGRGSKVAFRVKPAR